MIRTRLYRAFAFVSAVVGLLIFIVLYFREVEGQFETAFRDPRTILIFLLPFLPAFVLSILGERAHGKFLKALEKAAMAPPEQKKK